MNLIGFFSSCSIFSILIQQRGALLDVIHFDIQCRCFFIKMSNSDFQGAYFITCMGVSWSICLEQIEASPYSAVRFCSLQFTLE